MKMKNYNFDGGIFFTVLFSIYSFSLLQNLIGMLSMPESMSVSVTRVVVMMLMGTVFNPAVAFHMLALIVSCAAAIRKRHKK